MFKISYKRIEEKIGEKYGLQLDLRKGEIEHSVIKKTNFADLRDISQPYLRFEELCLAFICARHSMEMRKRVVLVSRIV